MQNNIVLYIISCGIFVAGPSPQDPDIGPFAMSPGTEVFSFAAGSEGGYESPAITQDKDDSCEDLHEISQPYALEADAYSLPRGVEAFALDKAGEATTVVTCNKSKAWLEVADLPVSTGAWMSVRQ